MKTSFLAFSYCTELYYQFMYLLSLLKCGSGGSKDSSSGFFPLQLM